MSSNKIPSSGIGFYPTPKTISDVASAATHGVANAEGKLDAQLEKANNPNLLQKGLEVFTGGGKRQKEIDGLEQARKNMEKIREIIEKTMQQLFS